jgi:hypothetical protein
VPEERLAFKLGDKGRTAAELMWHLVQSERGFAEGIAGLSFDSWTPEGQAPDGVAEIFAAYYRDIPPLMERLKLMTGEQLATPVNFMGVAHARGHLSWLDGASHDSPSWPAKYLFACDERPRAHHFTAAVQMSRLRRRRRPDSCFNRQR